MNNEMINHPSHYNQYPIEVIKLTEDLSFPLGNVVKYLLRAPFKGSLKEDIAKAKWYAEYIQAKRNKFIDLPPDMVEFDNSALVKFYPAILENVEDEGIALGIVSAVNAFYDAVHSKEKIDALNRFLTAVLNINVDSVQDEDKKQECDEKSSYSWHIVLKERPDKIHVSVESKGEGDPSDKAHIAYVALMVTLEHAIEKFKSIVFKEND